MLTEDDKQAARFIARAAEEGRRLYYSDLSHQFGRAPTEWRGTLDAIVEYCASEGMPLLPTIVVRRGEMLPPNNAPIYKKYGISDQEIMRREQERVFRYDWSLFLV